MGRLETLSRQRELLKRLQATASAVLDDDQPSVKPSTLSGDGARVATAEAPKKKAKR